MNAILMGMAGLLGFLGVVARFAGGIISFALLVYGVWTLVATSLASGLMLIGAAVVLGFLIVPVSAALMALSHIPANALAKRLDQAAAPKL